MPQVLVRDLDARVIERLKARAKRDGRSLQGELKVILEQAAARNDTEVRATIDRVRGLFSERSFSDSAVSIREDRQR